MFINQKDLVVSLILRSLPTYLFFNKFFDSIRYGILSEIHEFTQYCGNSIRFNRRFQLNIVSPIILLVYL